MEKELEKAIQLLESNDYIVVKKTLNEGIDIDYKNNLISYNPSHEKNVDTSFSNNPTNDTELIAGVPVWSIFKRKKGSYGDGNPLIYALKGEGEWSFATPKDKEQILKQFDDIANKFVRTHSFNVTVIIPSSNILNKFIASTITDKVENAEILEDVVCKLTTESLVNMVLKKDSKFKRYYKDNFEDAWKELLIYIDYMNKEKNGTFARHYVRNSEMRNVLDVTIELNKDKYAEFANKINGQDILIIDDTISRGQTIKEMVKNIKSTYTPRSITVLTLMSKLYD